MDDSFVDLALDKLEQSRDMLGLMNLGILEIFIQHLQQGIE